MTLPHDDQAVADTPGTFEVAGPGLADPSSDGISVLRLRGAVTRTELSTACEALRAAGPAPLLLLDVRDVTPPYPDTARVQLAAHLVVHFLDSRIALLAQQDAIKGVTAGIVSRAGGQLRKFWREPDARQWLLASSPRSGDKAPTAAS